VIECPYGQKIEGPVERAAAALQARLGEIGHRLSRKVLTEVANVARPKHAADPLAHFGSRRDRLWILHHARQRILDKRGELDAVLSPSLNIIFLGEFFVIFDHHTAG
jgi:hypothetical protein